MKMSSMSENRMGMNEQDIEKKLYNLRKFREIDNIEPTPYFFRDGVRRIHYIIVLHDRELYKRERLRNVLEYFNYLESQGLEFEVEVGLMDSSLVYMKVHAPDDVIRKFAYIYDTDLNNPGHDYIPDNSFRFRFRKTELTKSDEDVFKRQQNEITSCERILLLNKILSDPLPLFEEKHISGIEKMKMFGYIKDAYPLHDGPWDWTATRDQENLNDRQILVKYWASLSMWYKEQPINLIAKYFGTEVAFYFAWIEHFTLMLILVAAVGIFFTFLNMIIILSNPSISSHGICSSKKYMCPMCRDDSCDFVRLSNYCTITRMEFILGNSMNLVFALFISIWATVFVETWIRKESTLRVRWTVQHTDIEYKERYAYKDKAKYLRKSKITGAMAPYYPIGKKIMRYCFTYFINFLAVLVVASYVILLIILKNWFLTTMPHKIEPIPTLITAILYSSCQVIFIKAFSMFYMPLSMWLTRVEIPKTEKQFDDGVTYKTYIFGFINNYLPLLYTAFLRGKIHNLPALDTITGIFERDTCFPTGCILILAIQLLIVMVFKSFGGNLFAAIGRKMKNLWLSLLQTKTVKETEMYIPSWENEYYHTKYDTSAIAQEISEMVIQFGYVSFFMAAFPLIGLVALINNFIEIRTDAVKFIKETRRPVPKMIKGLGAWNEVFKFTLYFSIICNAFIVAFNTNSIQTSIYALYYQNDKTFIEFMFATYALKDLPPEYRQSEYNITECIYYGYRYPHTHPKKYQRTNDHYLVLTWKYVFVIIFENVILMIIHTIYYFVDEMPMRVKQQLHREELDTKKMKMKLLEEKIKKGN